MLTGNFKLNMTTKLFPGMHLCGFCTGLPTKNSGIPQDGRYWTGIGGAVDCVGSAILYSSTDLKTWDLEGDLGSQV